ncbi:hypothetical protein [Rhodococcus sp. SGAir0479]|uniref:hypothetical protein n=1 Tax=Rhodococcus sp. SGAir0479 TaxID=2567884 RepID=UPI0010CD5D10|nr:hypothetical protein [Rhodococcus sp. SGAir0479]QCQ91165.1 hypothetical protein E7742_07875 [Rhodococcus sp. SGAir0479]
MKSLVTVTVAVGAAALVLSACSGPTDPNAEPETAPEPLSPSATITAVDEQPQTGTWVRRTDWSSVSDLTGHALYEKMCSSQSEYFDLMGDPVRTRGLEVFDREQFARERVETMRSDYSWKATFSPADQELMAQAVLAAGRGAC